MSIENGGDLYDMRKGGRWCHSLHFIWSHTHVPACTLQLYQYIMSFYVSSFLFLFFFIISGGVPSQHGMTHSVFLPS